LLKIEVFRFNINFEVRKWYFSLENVEYPPLKGLNVVDFELIGNK
jgi:hypothetical protein